MRRIFVLVTLLALLAIGLVVNAQGQTIHVVQPGENLFRLSLRYNTTITAIAQANGIANPNLIFVGQRLIIPGPGQPPPPTPPPPPPTGEIEVVVRRGDTLGRLARQYNTTVAAIAQRNGIANPNLIFVGQRLIIPTGVTQPPGPQPTPLPPTPGPQPTPPPGAVNFETGGHVFSFAYPNEMRRAGMTWAKMQIRWNQGDPPSIALGAIDAARSRGFNVLLSVVGNPDQLGANPSQYFQDFANFLGGVAQLGPNAIEVWNEQNIDREWPRGQISPAAYTQMLAAAFGAIKRANPNVLVISGAPAPTGFFGGACTGNGCDDDAYIRGMAAAGAAQYADCIGIHYNEGILPPDATSGDPRGNPNHYTRYFPTMVNLYASVFPNKQLCFTEIGYLTPEGLGPLPPAFSWAAGTTIQQQADWLARAAVLSRQSGRIRLFIVWNIDSTNFGADPQAGYAIVRNGVCLACERMRTALGIQ